MNKFDSDNYVAQEFDNFEESLLALLHLVEQLKAENTALRAKQSILLEAHNALSDKNALARRKVTSILTRLKSMETEAVT